ncbi:MAG: DUF1761 domain-containing protein [candidate division Zixibacteria bacterium]
MESTGINYLAVFVAAAAYWLLGALWYSKAIFGKTWLEALGKSEEEAKKDHKPINLFWVLIFSFLSAYGIARILVWTSLEPVWGACAIAVVGVICFVIAPMATNDLMEHRPAKIFRMNAFYNFIGFIIMGLIIGLWR